MLTTSIILFIVFLFGSFLLTLLSHFFARLNKNELDLLSKKMGYPFFYNCIHRKLFKEHETVILTSAVSYAKHLLILGYGASCLLLILSLKHDDDILSWLWLSILLIVLAFTFLIFGDFFPKSLATKHPKGSFKLSSPFSSIYLTLCLPLTLAFLYFYKLISGKRPFYPEERPSGYVKEKIIDLIKDAASLDYNDKKLMLSVLKFKDRIVREVMIPRVDAFCLSAETTIKEATPEIIKEGYSRIPIYEENIDNIIGILLFKDVIALYSSNENNENKNILDVFVKDLVKEVIFTPETKKVSQLLQEFRHKQSHFAIVVDEYGGTEGIVTIEDLLEEIVGEISDEYDSDEEVLFTSQADGSWVIDARMSINDIEEKCALKIPQEAEYDTLGGYIFYRIGEIPRKGLKIHHDEFEIEVLSSNDRCIEKVQIFPKYYENK